MHNEMCYHSFVDTIILENMEDCCELYDVNNAPDCQNLMCEHKCEDKPWKFFETPKGEYKKTVKQIKSCCGEI